MAKPMEINPIKVAMAKNGENPTAENLKKARSIGMLKVVAIKCKSENTTNGKVHMVAKMKDNQLPFTPDVEFLFSSCIISRPIIALPIRPPLCVMVCQNNDAVPRRTLNSFHIVLANTETMFVIKIHVLANVIINGHVKNYTSLASRLDVPIHVEVLNKVNRVAPRVKNLAPSNPA